MKKLLCVLLSMCLIFCSFSFCFAAVSDSQAASIVADLSNIKTNIQNINNKLTDIKNYLYANGHSVAYYVEAISTWMSPIYNALTSIPVDNSTIIGALGYTDSNNTYHPYLNEINQSLNQAWSYTVTRYNPNDTITTETWTAPNTSKAIIDLLRQNSFNQSWGLHNLVLRTAYGDAARSYTDPSDLSVVPYTPRSWADSELILLQQMQANTARLSYVLASDERIAAQEAAADNEEAVVDNFIDSSGSGAASTSDIGSVSDLSSGYKQNFGSNASVTGIFDIFDSDHMGWFSQETKNQLDTTVSRSKGTESDTPLLDKQIQEIYDGLGVKMP